MNHHKREKREYIFCGKVFDGGERVFEEGGRGREGSNQLKQGLEPILCISTGHRTFIQPHVAEFCVQFLHAMILMAMI